MNYDIMLKNGQATIDFGQSDIGGEYKQSPSREYYMICDTLNTPSTSMEYLFVFTPKDVLYKKAIPGDTQAEWFTVFDDGGSIVITEECILILGNDGKQITKKKLPGFGSCDLIGRTLYVIGETDEGKKFLLLFDIDSKTSVLQIIPDLEYGDEERETQCSSDTETLFTGEKFVFVYENETDAIAFDLHGNKDTPTDIEIKTANMNRRERVRNYNIERARTSHEYWSKRLAQDKKARKDAAEIERATKEVQKYKERLMELGVDVSEPAPPLTSQHAQKKSFLAKLFRK